MKKVLFTILLSIIYTMVFSQIENAKPRTIDLSGLNIKPTEQPKEKEPETNIDSQLALPLKPNYLSYKSFSGLNYDSKIDDENFGILQPLQMNFSTATQENRYITNQQPRFLQKQEGDLQFFKRNQKIADLRTKSKFLILKFRDYANVDGDWVSLIVNDEVIIKKTSLVGGFSQVKIPLAEIGFYKIDFLALNMGEYAPNTAQLRIIDDQLDTLVNDKWALHTGFKATVVVIKE